MLTACVQADRVITIEDNDEIGLSTYERSTGRSSFDMYCFMLWPAIETCTSLHSSAGVPQAHTGP